jgi:hypothetical protein
MKKLIFIPLLFLFIFCEAQFTKGGGGFLKTGSSFQAASVVVPPAADYCDEYQAVYDEFGTPPSETNAGYQNTLVESLVADGIWAKFDVFYVFAGNNSANSLLNWINPGTFDASNVNSCPFTAYEGFTGTGGDYGYINTTYNPTTAGGNFVQDNASFGAWFLIDNIGICLGFHTNTNPAFLYLSGTLDEAWLNAKLNSSTLRQTQTNTAYMGLWTASRRSSTDFEYYLNDATITAIATTSTGLVNAVMEFVAWNTSYYSENQVAIGFAGSGLSDTDVSNLYDTLNTYLTAVGAI